MSSNMFSVSHEPVQLSCSLVDAHENMNVLGSLDEISYMLLDKKVQYHIPVPNNIDNIHSQQIKLLAMYGVLLLFFISTYPIIMYISTVIFKLCEIINIIIIAAT